MGGLSPLFLAWSYLRYKPGQLVSSVLLLSGCLTVLYTQVGLCLAARELSSGPATEPDSVAVRILLVQGFFVGAVGVFLLLVLLLNHILGPIVASQQHDFALLYRLGYSPGYLCSVVVAEMLLVVLLACVPTVLMLAAVYVPVRTMTELPLALRWRPLGTLLLLTLLLAATVGLRGSRQIKAIRESEYWSPRDLIR